MKRLYILLIAILQAVSPAPADEKADPTPAAAEDPGGEISFNKIGNPLRVLADGREVRTIYVYEGRSTVDKRDPASRVYYHGLDLAPVRRDLPIRGFPEWVSEVTRRDRDAFLTIRFRLTSPRLRAACVAQLLSDERDRFERERVRLNVPALKVVVERVPATELFVAIQDVHTGLTLSYATRLITQDGDDVAMSFKFNPDTLALFLRYYDEGSLQFKPYYKVRADRIAMGHRRTEVKYSLGLAVRESLDHRQQERRAGGEHTILPITEGDVRRIARRVAMEIVSDVDGDPSVLAFLREDPALVSSCFEPATTMSYADFVKAFPDYTEQMLAEHLKPHGVFRHESKAVEVIKGKQGTDEETKRAGLGFGLNLAVGPLARGNAAQAEAAERTLDTVYNATGVRLVKGGGENSYVPADIKVYRLAKGYEERNLVQAGTVTLVKGPVKSYLEESPIPQSYAAKLVDDSLALTLTRNDHVARLLAEKAKLEAALDAGLAKVEKSRAGLKATIGSIDAERKKVYDAHVTALTHAFNSGQCTGMVDYTVLAKTVGWPGCPDGRCVPSWSANRDATNAKTEERKAAAAAGYSTIDKHVATAAADDAALVASLAEITRLRGEIARVTKEILTILER